MKNMSFRDRLAARLGRQPTKAEVDAEIGRQALDRALIEAIVNRAWKLPWARDAYAHASDLRLDLMAVHMWQTPLRLKDLLEASEFDFAHDIEGIRCNLDRSGLRLLNCFTPRFAAAKG